MVASTEERLPVAYRLADLRCQEGGPAEVMVCPVRLSGTQEDDDCPRNGRWTGLTELLEVSSSYFEVEDPATGLVKATDDRHESSSEARS